MVINWCVDCAAHIEVEVVQILRLHWIKQLVHVETEETEALKSWISAANEERAKAIQPAQSWNMIESNLVKLEKKRGRRRDELEANSEFSVSGSKINTCKRQMQVDFTFGE